MTMVCCLWDVCVLEPVEKETPGVGGGLDDDDVWGDVDDVS